MLSQIFKVFLEQEQIAISEIYQSLLSGLGCNFIVRFKKRLLYIGIDNWGSLMPNTRPI